jgi:hypothetical protein
MAGLIVALNAPSGSGRADSVPTTQATRSFAVALRANTSRASLVFPTPAAPTITTPA